MFVFKIVIAIMVLYVLPSIISYRFMQKAYYHPKGRWLGIIPHAIDIMLTFAPIGNLIFIFVVYFIENGWKHSKYIDRANKIANFFRPRKSFKK